LFSPEVSVNINSSTQYGGEEGTGNSKRVLIIIIYLLFVYSPITFSRHLFFTALATL
jgi:hypothetical protein